jgi:hypothetical protein
MTPVSSCPDNNVCLPPRDASAKQPAERARAIGHALARIGGDPSGGIGGHKGYPLEGSGNRHNLRHPHTERVDR